MPSSQWVFSLLDWVGWDLGGMLVLGDSVRSSLSSFPQECIALLGMHPPKNSKVQMNKNGVLLLSTLFFPLFAPLTPFFRCGGYDRAITGQTHAFFFFSPSPPVEYNYTGASGHAATTLSPTLLRPYLFPPKYRYFFPKSSSPSLFEALRRTLFIASLRLRKS